MATLKPEFNKLLQCTVIAHGQNRHAQRARASDEILGTFLLKKKRTVNESLLRLKEKRGCYMYKVRCVNPLQTTTTNRGRTLRQMKLKYVGNVIKRHCRMSQVMTTLLSENLLEPTQQVLALMQDKHSSSTVGQVPNRPESAPLVVVRSPSDTGSHPEEAEAHLDGQRSFWTRHARRQ